MKPHERIIVALDVPSVKRAYELVEELEPHVGGFKVGLQLIYAIVRLAFTADYSNPPEELTLLPKLFEKMRGKMFLDSKLCDIPNTVKGASVEIAGLGAGLFNVHASSGIDAMTDAVSAGGEISRVLAVTVLTSFEENDGHVTFGLPTKAKVLEFARNAKLAGVYGIICSPQELEILKKRRELKGLIFVIPGIRPEWAATGDQKRIMTPAMAIKAGADMLVIGRPITDPPKDTTPVNAAIAIAEEIEHALEEMEKAA